MRFGIGVLLLAAVLAGCGGKTKKLSAVERDHYYALKVWMSPTQDKAYFKYKTEEERNAFLKEAGLWDRFYKYPPEVRELIAAGEVKVGWMEDQMFMAWGQPHDRLRLTGRPASRSELFRYRFEVDNEGYIRVWDPKSKTAYKAVSQYQLDVYVDDSRIAEIVKKAGWPD